MNITSHEINDAIRQHDDSEHEDGVTPREVNRALESINQDVLDFWSEHEDSIDNGTLEIVKETDEVLVLADYEGHYWSTQFETLYITDEPLQRIIQTLHHEMANWHCDYSWSVSAPVVVEKPNQFQAGEAHVLREVARRTDETGSVARAVDQLAIEAHGYSKSQWASLTGRNPSTVTRTTTDKEGQ